jgi:neutral amino acid transport system permease protein
VLSEVTREYNMPNWIILNANNFGQVKFILVGIGLVLLVVYRPQGIFGDKREQVFDVR